MEWRYEFPNAGCLIVKPLAPSAMSQSQKVGNKTKRKNKMSMGRYKLTVHWDGGCRDPVALKEQRRVQVFTQVENHDTFIMR